MSEDKFEDSAEEHDALGEFEEEYFDDDEYEQSQGESLEETGRLLSGSQEGPQGADTSWWAATHIVQEVRPVPRLLWNIIRSVYGKSGVLGEPDPMSFYILQPLMEQAAKDATMSQVEKRDPGVVVTLSQAIETIGGDVAGALCFLHSVCRRVSTALPERVWRPILDDALLRAHIGFHAGDVSPVLGPGRGMLAGFAGRCGLAVQIASGSADDAQKALSGLAAGEEMRAVCIKVYGCDPLQVAALTLIAGGCSRDIALGIAAYGYGREELVPGSEQHRWFTVFSVIEDLRMGRREEIPKEQWRTLGCDPAAQELLNQAVVSVQRRGHGWRWVTQPMAPPGQAKKPKRRIGDEKARKIALDVANSEDLLEGS